MRRVFASVIVVSAFVALAPACGNDFDALFKAGVGTLPDGGVDPCTVAGGTCNQSCTSTTTKCDYTCSGCNGTFKCNDNTTCTVSCASAATCASTCDEGKGCAMSCSPDSECILYCKSSTTCTLDCKGGQKRSCDNNVFTCNRDCP